MKISHPQIKKLSGAILNLYLAATPAEIPAAFMRAVREILDCEHLSYNEFGSDHFCGIIEPVVDERLNQIFERLAHEHPSIRYINETGSTESVMISDLMPAAQWQRTTLYNEFFRPLGIQHQLALMFPVGTIQIGFAANRERQDFTKEERFLLDLLQPHLVQAYLNAKAMERTTRAGDAQGGGTIVLADDCTVLYASPKARKAVKRFFGAIQGKRLPEELLRWVKRGLDARLFDPTVVRPHLPLTKSGENSVLTVRLCPNFAAGEHALVVDEQPIEVPLEVFEQFGHSRREAEVLSWIAQGKTNPEIAIILGISPRTVAHHVEHILARLGVEGRGSASAWAQETMRIARLNWTPDEPRTIVPIRH